MDEKKQNIRLARAFGSRTNQTLGQFKSQGVRVHQVTRGIKHLTLHVLLNNTSELEKLVSDKFAESLSLAVNLDYVLIKRSQGLLQISFTLPEQYHKPCLWSTTTGAGIGLADSDAQVEYSFSDQGPQILIGSATGSGKTVTGKAILLSILRSEPNTRLVLVDPNQQFSEFENALALAQPIANNGEADIERNVDFIFQEYLKRETTHKGGTPESEPRFVFVMDEAEHVLTNPILTKLNKVAAQGRKYRVNMIIITQYPNQESVGRMLNNLTQRYVGNVVNAQVSALITGHKGLNCHHLTGKGSFVQILGGKPTYFQVGNVLPSDFTNLPRGEVSFGQVELRGPIQEDHTPSTNVNANLVLAETETNKGGRPRREIKPQVLAHYLVRNDITTKVAKNELGLSQKANEEYREFSRIVRETMNLLKADYN